MTIDLHAFLNRIGYDGPIEPTAAMLSDLHWSHLCQVPFENLDIRPLHRRISLDLAALEEKIVVRRRGGFCYELNSLFAAALAEIGFAVDIVSVQFVRADSSLSPPFDHMALLVQPPGDPLRYLADVGCGNDSPARPLPLVRDQPVTHAETGVSCRLLDLGEHWRYERKEPDGLWKTSYVFTVTPRAVDEFTDRCRFQDSDPASHFTSGPICSLATRGGRITIAGDRVIVTRGGEREEQELASPEAFAAALREHFGIVL
jgi:N-hydroxyarylamine O-acetyltransferase